MPVVFAVTPVVRVKQAPAVTSPTLKPSASRKPMFPADVVAAAKIPEITFVALSSSIFPVARTPRFVAVMMPDAFWVMLPPPLCNRTVKPPALIAVLTAISPVVTQSSRLVLVMPVTPGVKQPSAVTVPIVTPSAST